MKKWLLMLLVICYIGQIEAQKLKFEDDLVLNDKTPIVKIEGETKKLSARVNLTFKTMGGKILFTVNSKNTNFLIPDYSQFGFYDRDWAEVHFPDLNKTIKIEKEIFRTKKGVAKFFLSDLELPVLKDTVVNPDAVAALAAKYNTGDNIDKMIADVNQLESESIKQLANFVSRDFMKPVVLVPAGSTNGLSSVSTSFIIQQDNKEIGVLTKKVETNLGSTITQTTYTIYKKPNTPMSYNGKQLGLVFVGILKGASSFPTLTTLKDKKKHEFKTSAGQILAPETVVDYLVKNEYL
jgi:hypothetical protein